MDEDPLYHVTYYNRLPSVAEFGLTPGSPRAVGGEAYDAHAARGIFLTEPEGVRFWHTRAEEFAQHNSDDVFSDGLVPVVLRVTGVSEDDLEEDQHGSSDARADSYIFPGSIDVEQLELWDGEEWIDVEDWLDIDPAIAIRFEEDEDGDQLVYFKLRSPLLPDLED